MGRVTVFGPALEGFMANGAVKMSRSTTERASYQAGGVRESSSLCSDVVICMSTLRTSQWSSLLPDLLAKPLTLMCPTVCSGLASEVEVTLTLPPTSPLWPFSYSQDYVSFV